MNRRDDAFRILSSMTSPHSVRTLPVIDNVPLHAAIVARAQDLWVRHGRPEDRDEAIWIEAARFIFFLTPVLH